MVELNTTKAALEQIEKCSFECEGGPLSNNVGWRWLKEHLDGGPLYCLGQSVNYTVAGEVSGVKISQVVTLCVVGVFMGSDTDRRTWSYTLSADPPRPYYYGAGPQFHAVPEESLTPFSPTHEHGEAS